jgi:hypothetical protein
MPKRMATSGAWGCQYRIAYPGDGRVRRVSVASQAVACVPFGALSALRYVHMVYKPVIADHFPVCLPRRTPVDPGKGSRGTVKPFRTRTSQISSPRTYNEHTFTHCTLHMPLRRDDTQDRRGAHCGKR